MSTMFVSKSVPGEIHTAWETDFAAKGLAILLRTRSNNVVIWLTQVLIKRHPGVVMMLLTFLPFDI